MKKQLLYQISLCLGVFLFAAALQATAFTNPTSNPTAGNVDAPLNTGGIFQTKQGGVILNTNGATYGLSVAQGNVGIGNLTPAFKLDVAGKIHATDDVCTDLGGGKCLSTVADGGGGGGTITGGACSSGQYVSGINKDGTPQCTILPSSTVLPGTWCGSATVYGSENSSARGTGGNADFTCQGHNPFVSCPVGYSMKYVTTSPADYYGFYAFVNTCVKN